MNPSTYLILFLIVCFAILALCIYKVYAWFKRPEVRARIDNYKGQQQSIYKSFPIYRKVKRVRNGTALSMCIVLIIIFTLHLTAVEIPKHLFGGMMLGSFILIIIINNFLIGHIWRCPHCHKPLPIKIGKGGIHPSLTEKCPSCGKTLY
ncbi:hypothetical protein [Dysgonomonas macrotermitis]|uniref:Uncharacterized protein n=1 Tax=Dysgonomonas macrotermitis TaxID=1346286 RepID=A0A1M4WV71_9BACT|nr:hypothetical protein [Dysgonomonas macrotermitis]SHE84953.1 hypothetical protein SAMN05444362_102322 [Dysgonomonas macrotermitis]